MGLDNVLLTLEPVKRMTPEGRVRNEICSYLTFTRVFNFIHDSVGIYDEKKKAYRSSRSPYRKRGVSDVLGIYKGHFLAIEVKTETRKNLLGEKISSRTYPTAEQTAFIEQVRKQGGIAFVARCIEDVKRELAIWENAHRDGCPCHTLEPRSENPSPATAPSSS